MRGTRPSGSEDGPRKRVEPKGRHRTSVRPNHHAASITARMPGVATKELMARIGHASPRAALRYQHATAERDLLIAAFLDEQVKAETRDERARIMPLTNSAREAGAGLEP